MDSTNKAGSKSVDAAVLRGDQDGDILRHVLNNVRDMAYSLNLRTGTYDYLSPALTTLTGFERSEFLALGAEGIAQRFHPADREQYENHFNEITVQTGDLIPVIEYRWKNKDGQYRWYSDSRTLIRDETGNPVAITGSVRDITDRRRAEEENRSLQAQFRHAQKMEAIGRLAGGVAHDFNNLLTGITGYASLLQMELADSEEQGEIVAGILAACERARNLTTNLLGFARRGTFHRQPIDVAESFRKVTGLLRQTVSRLITLQTHVEPGLPRFEGDVGQVDQILMNLCINGVDAMGGEGTLVLSARAVDAEASDEKPGVAPGRYIEIAVSDTGAGMRPEEAEQAFEPFFTTKPHGEGTGLGLSMVYGAVRNHGGTVSLTSECAKGTTVTMLFPALDAGGEETPPPVDHAPELVTGQGTILLVDDEQAVRESTTKLLSKLGYDVVEAVNGEEAVAIYSKNPTRFSLVLLDMAMPVMGGAEAFSRLKQIDPEVCVLIFSGFSADDKIDCLISQGATDFLQKPFQAHVLAETVAKALAG